MVHVVAESMIGALEIGMIVDVVCIINTRGIIVDKSSRESIMKINWINIKDTMTLGLIGGAIVCIME